VLLITPTRLDELLNESLEDRLRCAMPWQAAEKRF